MPEQTAPVIPAAVRRNHWMNQVATHSEMKPDATALKFLGEVTTWRQAAERMDSFAAALARRGVGFGDRVLLLTLNRPATWCARTRRASCGWSTARRT